MQYVELGRTGLRVSRLVLGTMNFGNQTSERDAFAIMDRALELGINFFDTADRYGGEGKSGLTEEIIGRWLAQGGRRDQIVLATKVYGPMGTGVNDRGLSAYHIRRAARASLKRLQTDHIDLYQMHHIDRGELAAHQRGDIRANVAFHDSPHLTPGTPWDEIWQVMGQLITQGDISYVGSSNFAGWNIAQASESARRRGLLGLVSEQSVYNLTKRHVELEVIPASREYGLGLIPWSPLGGGLLAGGLSGADTVRRKKLNLSDDLKSRAAAYEALCARVGESPANVALAWLLHNPVVTGPIIGPRTLAQLEDSVRALDIKLSASVLRELDDLFPGPGGEAPMAYAW